MRFCEICMISSLLLINTINKIFGKHSAETTTSQKYHNLNGRCLLSDKPGIIIYARYSNRKENPLKEEFWIPNHKHVALYGFVFFSVACSWNNTPLALAVLLNCRAITAAAWGQPTEGLWDVPALSAASLLKTINPSELERGTSSVRTNPGASA